MWLHKIILDEHRLHISDRIRFWAGLWWQILHNPYSDEFGWSPTGVHAFIDELLAELETNGASNSENIKIFKNRAERLLTDSTAKSIVSAELILLHKMLQKTQGDRVDREIILSRRIKAKLYGGNFFRLCFERLKVELLDSSPLDNTSKDSIRTLSDLIIYEFLLNGYTIESLENLAVGIFAEHAYYDDFLGLHTYYPVGIINPDHYISDNKFDGERYAKDIKSLLETFTVEDHLESLQSFYNSPPRTVNYIFPIEGLVGELDVNIGPVRIYSPKKIRIINRIMESEDVELFGREIEQAPCNVAFTSNSFSTDFGRRIAAYEISNAFALLNVFVEFAEKGFYGPDFSRWVITLSNGDVVPLPGAIKLNKENPVISREASGLSILIEGPMRPFIQSLFRPSNNQTRPQQQLTFALQWLRKAEESVRPEDSLVNYWIALEKLFDADRGRGNKAETIVNYAVSIEVPRIIRNKAINLRDLIFEVGNVSVSNGPVLNVSSELKLLANLLESDVRSRQTFPIGFVSHISDLKLQISEPALLMKLQELENFYASDKNHYTKIEKIENQVRTDIRSIYRIRNQIVHNAQYDPLTLPYYVKLAQRFAISFLRTVIREYSSNETEELLDVFQETQVQYDLFCEQIREEKKFKFSDWPFHINPE